MVNHKIITVATKHKVASASHHDINMVIIQIQP